VQGIGVSADSSFDNMTTNRFRSYALSASFSVPFGNRGPRARLHQAKLRETQAVVGLHQVIDGIVQEVNNAVRALQVRYTQISPQFDAVRAAERNLRALAARTQAISPSYLETELSAVEQLANTRNRLLLLVTDYNIGVADLERAKGTLLEYNNIVLTDAPPQR
jgi:outer membrane protein TolC